MRDSRATYLQSLAVLRAAKAEGVYTKTSIMLGLGETDDEVIDTLLDLKSCGVDIVTFGQYLQPTPLHLAVTEYVHPDKFDHWRKYGEEVVGFRYAAAPCCVCLCGECWCTECTLLAAGVLGCHGADAPQRLGCSGTACAVCNALSIRGTEHSCSCLLPGGCSWSTPLTHAPLQVCRVWTLGPFVV